MATIGYTSTYSSAYGLSQNDAVGMRLTMPVNGTIQSLTIRCYGLSSNFKAVIWNGNGTVNTVGGVGNMYNKIKTFEIWFRRVVAVIFIAVGLYYITFLF